MKIQLRRRALRAISASLVNSSFSLSELKDVAAALRQDPSFADDLSQLCIALGNALSNALPDEKPTTGAKRDPWVNKVYRVIQRKRISKRDLVSALQRIPIDVPMSFAETRTTLEILEYVKQNMPRSTLEKVLSQLNSRAAEGDAYLEGILKRTPED